MGKFARIMLFITTALAFAIAASGSVAIADTGGPGVSAPVVARP
jgi:hypothetical protein